MIQITEDKYYSLTRIYGSQLQEETKQRVWLDNSFYVGFRRWLKETYNIDNNGNSVLTFENDHDYTMFMLRWEHAKSHQS